MAELGVGILIIPQKSWDDTVTDIKKYNTVYEAINNRAAPPPISAGWVFCDPDPVRAREMAAKALQRPLADDALRILMRGADKEDQRATTRRPTCCDAQSGSRRADSLLDVSLSDARDCSIPTSYQSHSTGALEAPTRLGSDDHPVIEPAPGRYVKQLLGTAHGSHG